MYTPTHARFKKQRILQKHSEPTLNPCNLKLITCYFLSIDRLCLNSLHGTPQLEQECKQDVQDVVKGGHLQL